MIRLMSTFIRYARGRLHVWRLIILQTLMLLCNGHLLVELKHAIRPVNTVQAGLVVRMIRRKLIDTLNTTTPSDNQPKDGQSLTELMPPHGQPDAGALGVKFSMLRSQREYVFRFCLPGFKLDGIALTTKGYNKRTMHLIADRWDADGNVQFGQRITFSADAAL